MSLIMAKLVHFVLKVIMLITLLENVEKQPKMILLKTAKFTSWLKNVSYVMMGFT